jgi:hypothetical protein
LSRRFHMDGGRPREWLVLEDVAKKSIDQRLLWRHVVY